MLINFGDELDKVDQIRKGILKEAPRIGIDEIDNVIRFKRNLTCFAGHANVGKTSIILYFMMVFAQKHKIKFLVFSSENEPYSIIRKLIEYKSSKPINKISKTELYKHSQFVNKHFKFIDCVKKYNVGMWLIMHSVTEAFRKRYGANHEYAGHPLPLAMSDVEGGNVYGNRTDDFYTIHRLTQHESRWIYTELHCKKIKDHDTGTKPTGFDSPLILESIVNNVGYKMGEQTTINKSVIEQLNFPF